MKLYALLFPTVIDNDKYTREYLLTGITPPKGHKSNKLVAFKSYDDAVLAAKSAAAELTGKSKGKEYPVYTIEVKDESKLEATKYSLNKKKKLDSVFVPFAAFTPVSASLKHVDAKKFAKEIDLTETVSLKDRAKNAANKAKDAAQNAAKKAQDTAKSTFETVKKHFPVKTVAATATVAAAAAGFYYTGGVAVATPYAAAAAAKVGLALPSVLATSIGLSLGAGVLALGVAAGLYYGVSKAISYVKAAYAKSQRTPKEAYEDAVKAEKTAVADLEKKLDPKNRNDKGLLNRFADLVKSTPEHRFNKDGSEAKRQPKHDKLCVLQFEHRKLAEVVAIKDAKERAKAEAKVQNDITNQRFSVK